MEGGGGEHCLTQSNNPNLKTIVDCRYFAEGTDHNERPGHSQLTLREECRLRLKDISAQEG
jgi:hypothetical protein